MRTLSETEWLGEALERAQLTAQLKKQGAARAAALKASGGEASSASFEDAPVVSKMTKIVSRETGETQYVVRRAISRRAALVGENAPPLECEFVLRDLRGGTDYEDVRVTAVNAAGLRSAAPARLKKVTTLPPSLRERLTTELKRVCSVEGAVVDTDFYQGFLQRENRADYVARLEEDLEEALELEEGDAFAAAANAFEAAQQTWLRERRIVRAVAVEGASSSSSLKKPNFGSGTGAVSEELELERCVPTSQRHRPLILRFEGGVLRVVETECTRLCDDL